MKNRKLIWFLLLIVALAVVFWPGKPQPPAPAPQPQQAAVQPAAQPIGAPVQIKAPLGLAPVPIPADNPPTAATIALGRRLYYDPILSVDNTVSCATCHDPKFGFSDGKSVSEGVGKKTGTRNAPTVFNAAYYSVQFWDGRAPSLEKQAEGPVQNPVEMVHTLEGCVKRLEADPSYKQAFEEAFGPGPITFDMVGKAIASFERTVVSGDSPFDRYFYGGQKYALSASARRGLEVFRDPAKGNCAVCHTIGEKDALFSDDKFHNIGVGVKDGQPTDLGRYEVTKNDADRGAFKTPSLRNVALTAPYFHDGSRKTLKEVIDFYIGGGNSNPHLDKEVKVLDFLSGQERTDLLAFLESLTGTMPANVGRPEKEKKAETNASDKGGN